MGRGRKSRRGQARDSTATGVVDDAPNDEQQEHPGTLEVQEQEATTTLPSEPSAAAANAPAEHDSSDAPQHVAVTTTTEKEEEESPRTPEVITQDNPLEPSPSTLAVDQKEALAKEAATVTQSKPAAPHAACPEYDRACVAELRAQLRTAASRRPTPDAADLVALAQKITNERYPLTATEQKKLSATKDAVFHAEVAQEVEGQKRDWDGGGRRRQSPSPPSAVETEAAAAAPPPPPATAAVVENPSVDGGVEVEETLPAGQPADDASVPPPASTSTLPPPVPTTSADDTQESPPQHQRRQQVTVLKEEEELITPEEAERLRRKTIADVQKLLDEIEAMKDYQDSWKTILQQMFAQEAEEDERARKIFLEVMTSEAFFLGDTAFHSWMRGREAVAAGVGSERVFDWFHHDELWTGGKDGTDANRVPLLYTAVVPRPRDMTTTSDALLASTVEEMIEEAQLSASHGLPLVPETTPPHPHHNDVAAVVPPTSYDSAPKGATGLEIAELARSDARLRAFFDQCPALLLMTREDAHRSFDRSSFAVTLFVVGGRLLAVEPHSKRDTLVGVRWPTRSTSPGRGGRRGSISRRLDNAESGGEDEESPADRVRSAVGDAAVRFFGRMRSHLPSRTFVVVARVFSDIPPAAAPSSEASPLAAEAPQEEVTQYDLRLMSVAPLEARDYTSFKWPDLVGLITMAMHQSRRPDNIPPEEPAVPPSELPPFDAEATKATLVVRGRVKMVPPYTAPPPPAPVVVTPLAPVEDVIPPPPPRTTTQAPSDLPSGLLNVPLTEETATLSVDGPMLRAHTLPPPPPPVAPAADAETSATAATKKGPSAATTYFLLAAAAAGVAAAGLLRNRRG